jgi:hypothetical protein
MDIKSKGCTQGNDNIDGPWTSWEGRELRPEWQVNMTILTDWIQSGGVCENY